MKQSFITWVPSILCIILAFFEMQAKEATIREQATLLLFLAACFSVVGIALSEMRRQVRQLNQQLADSKKLP